MSHAEECSDGRYILDDAGNATAETVKNSLGTVTLSKSLVYNALGRLTQQIGAAGQTVADTYDGNGNVVTQTDPMDRITHYAYDALDRLDAITDPMQQQTALSYDARDDLLSVTDPRSLTTSYLNQWETQARWPGGVWFASGIPQPEQPGRGTKHLIPPGELGSSVPKQEVQRFITDSILRARSKCSRTTSGRSSPQPPTRSVPPIIFIACSHMSLPRPPLSRPLLVRE